MSLLTNRIQLLFLLALAGSLFLTFPLALIPQGFVSAAFEISLPSLFILTLMTIPVILGTPVVPGIVFGIGMAVFGISVLFNMGYYRSHLVESVELLGYIAIPLAVAIVRKTDGRLTFERVANIGFVLWAVQIFLGYMSLGYPQLLITKIFGCLIRFFGEPVSLDGLVFYSDVVGLSGNRNWAASVILASMPWAYARISYWMSRFSQPRLATLASILLCVPPTLWLTYKCASRGAWLALIAVGILYAFLLMRRLERALLSIFLALGAALLLHLTLLHYPLKLIDTIRRDVRIPMWAATLSMTRDHDIILSSTVDCLRGRKPTPSTLPALLGVGPGRFTERYTHPYRAHSTYHDRLVAAAVTIHPHNEFLNIAAQVGVAAAAAWLLLLVPLFRKGEPDRLFGCCRFSAFLIIAHSMLDMTMVRAPGNIFGLFALGVCWSPMLRATAWSALQSRFGTMRRVLVPAAVCVLLVGATAAAIHDVRVDHHFRRAFIDEEIGRKAAKGGLEKHAHKYYASTFDHYSRAADIDPGNIRAFLFAGVVAIDKLEDPDRALPHLQRAHELDSTFGHLNNKIGKAFVLGGRHDLALKFYEREMALYPRLPEAFQRYFVCLAVTDRLDELPAMSERLKGIYRTRAELRMHRPGLEALAARWLAQVRAADGTEAAASARELCMYISSIFVDPAFYLITAGQSWPRHEFLLGKFNDHDDFFYWYQLVLCRNIAETAEISAGGVSADPLRQLEALVRVIRERVKIDPKTGTFAFPENVWTSGEGSVISCYCLFAGAAYQRGCDTILYLGDNGAPEYCIVSDGTFFFRVDLQAQTVTPVVAAQGATGKDTGAVTFQWQPGRMKAVCMPQEFLLKNQILGTLIREYGGDAAPVFDEMPTLKLIRSLGLNPARGGTVFADLREHCARQPIDYLYDRIQESLAAEGHGQSDE